jgi:hypothetical protein
LGEQRLAAQHLRVVGAAARGRGQGGLVEDHVVEGGVVDLRPRGAGLGRRHDAHAAGALAATVRGGQAVGLRGGAGLVREQAAGDAHVAQEGAGGLVRDVGLPAKAADALGAGHGVPGAVGMPLDGVGRRGLRGGIGLDVGLGDGLQQADAGQLRRDAGADHGARGQRAVTQAGQRVERLAQRVARGCGSPRGPRA